MRKKIILFTSMFPWGDGEAFLETEIKYYHNCEVIIVPLKVEKGSKKRRLAKNVRALINVEKKTWEKFLLGAFCILSKDCMDEILFLIKKKKLNLKAIKKIVTDTFYANLIKKRAESVMRKMNISPREVVFYSYWMSAGAFAAILLKRKYKESKALCRCHGGDLYEENQSSGCMPFRCKLKELDAICPISYDGKNYLERKYDFLDKNKINVFNLGIDNDFQPAYRRGKKFRILTCSSLISLKQVEKVALALGFLKNERVEWIHIGSGEGYGDIVALAKEILKGNVSYHFAGQMSNKEVVDNYRSNDYDLFINASKSEGIPVSIMEAISFGIPVIATKVGGNSEIVIDGENGRLIPSDFQPKQLADLILEFYYMDNASYMKYRENAYKIWKDRYNANENYMKFMQFLQAL